MAKKNQVEVRSNLKNASEFLDLLKENSNLELIKQHICTYANQKFDEIRRSLISAPKDDTTTPFLGLLQDENAHEFFNKILIELSVTNRIQDLNVFTELLEIIELYNYFFNLQKQNNANEERAKEEMDEEENIQSFSIEVQYEKALQLQKLLPKINLQPIKLVKSIHQEQDIPVKESPKPRLNNFHEKKSKDKLQSKPVSGLFEPEWGLKFKERPIFSRIIRYIKANPIKLLVGTALGLTLGIPAFFFLPITAVPIFIITVCLITVGGGILGFSLTGVLHYLLSPQTKIHVNAPLVSSTDEKPLVRTQMPDQTETEKNRHSNLLLLLRLLSPSLAEKSARDSEYSLIGLIKSNLIINISNKRDPYELVRNFFQQRESSFINMIDFDLIENNSEKLLNYITPETQQYYDSLKFHARSMRMQALMQLKESSQFKIERMQKLNATEFKQLEDQCNALDPLQIARSYFINLGQYPQEAEKLITLFKNIQPNKKKEYDRESLRIKNVMLYFVNKSNRTPIKINDISDQQLVKKFEDKLLSLNGETIAKMNLNFLMTESPESYDLEFLSKFICANNKFALATRSKLNLKNVTPKLELILRGIQLFLNAACPNDDSVSDLKTSEKMSLFYLKLNELNVHQVIEIFSDIRFNTYVKVELEALQELIESRYQRAKKLEFKDGMKTINAPEFVKVKTTPKLNVIKNFVSVINTQYSKNTIQDMKARQLLPLFYEALNNLTTTDLLELFKRNLIITNPGQGTFMLQLLYGYFQFMRPNDFGEFKKIFPKNGKFNLFNISPSQSVSDYFHQPKDSNTNSSPVIVPEPAAVIMNA